MRTHPCPHCGQKDDLPPVHGPDTLYGAYTDRDEASAHAVLADNTVELTCRHCGKVYWLALIDQRW